MKLEVGKTYLDRQGTPVTITEYKPSNLSGEYGNGYNEWWHENGSWWRDISKKSNADLVREAITIIKEKNQMLELINSVKDYIRANRNLIYTVITIYLVDRFLLDGALQAKLRDTLTKISGRKLDEIDPK